MAADPELKKYLWWKRYITVLQMAQFLILFIHWVTIFFAGCDVPLLMFVVGTIQAFAMFYLFGDFYLRTYVWKKENKVE